MHFSIMFAMYLSQRIINGQTLRVQPYVGPNWPDKFVVKIDFSDQKLIYVD